MKHQSRSAASAARRVPILLFIATVALLLAFPPPPAPALPIGPEALPRNPEKIGEDERELSRDSLKPESFQVDLIRLGLENGLASKLVRIDKTLAASVRNSALHGAMLQLQEIQAGDSIPKKDVDEDGPVPGSPGAAPHNQPPPPLIESRPGAPAWQIGGNPNAAGTPFIGTTDPNGTDRLHAGAQGKALLRLEANPVAANVLAGYAGNVRGVSVGGATISGGGVRGEPNRVTTDFSTVGGGVGNVAGGDANFIDSPFATVSGGRNNIAGRRHTTVAGGVNNRAMGLSASVSGGASNHAMGDYAVTMGGSGNLAGGRFAVMGGGETNRVPGEFSVILGGRGNEARGVGSSIGGGVGNRATGSYATIPGGRLNEAAGAGSFAAGSLARSLHEGSMVFADATKASFASTGPNQFLIRATGNVGIDTPLPTEKLTVAGNIAPAQDDTFTLGSDDRRWREIKLSSGIDTVGQFVITDRGAPRLLLDDQGNLKVSGKVIMDAFGGPGSIAPSVQALRAGSDPRVARLETRLTALEQNRSAKPGPDLETDSRLQRLETSIRNLPPPGPAPQLTARLQRLESAVRDSTPPASKPNPELMFRLENLEAAARKPQPSLPSPEVINRLEKLEAQSQKPRSAAIPKIDPSLRHDIELLRREQNNLQRQVTTASSDIRNLQNKPTPVPTIPKADSTLRKTGEGYEIRHAAGKPANAILAKDSGVWLRRNARDEMKIQGELDPSAVLQRLATVPILAYSDGENEALRIGPAAENFNQSMGLTGPQEYVDTASVDGILIAAVQELASQLKTMKEENAALKSRIEALEQQ